MTRSTVLILCFMLLLGGVATGRKTVTTRHKLRVDASALETADTVRLVVPEIIVPHDTLTIVASGFDKPLGSLNETMFVTNRFAADVTAVYFTLDYFDRQGRQLHRVSRRIDVDLPAGETRQLIFPSWDRQKSFYYISGRQPRTKATPFSISCRIDSVEIIPAQ